MLIGSNVPVENSTWEVFLQFRYMVQLMLQPSFSHGEIKQLGAEIKRFLALYRSAFPDDPFTIKFHLLTHYPSIIEHSGPVVFLSSIRLEGKHKELKKFCEMTSNTINLCHTIVKRHQIRHAIRCLYGHGVSEKIQYKTKPKLRALGDLAYSDLVVEKTSLALETVVETITQVDVNGCTFKMGSYIFMGYNRKEERPVYKEIKDILGVFCCRMYFCC